MILHANDTPANVRTDTAARALVLIDLNKIHISISPPVFIHYTEGNKTTACHI
jgi:hypothetical protein